jgi:hypothetical protein
MREKRKVSGGIYEMRTGLRFFSLFRSFLIMTFLTILAGGCAKDENLAGFEVDQMKAAGIYEVIPLNLTDSVSVDPTVSVTFKPGTDPSVVSATLLSLKNSISPVTGKITFSGTTAIFTPDTDLNPETEYTATVKTIKPGSQSNSDSHEYSWRFKTGKNHKSNSLSVVSTDPADKAAGVPVSSSLTVTFNQEMTLAMSNSASVTLKKGQSTVEGSLTFSGKTAVFKPTVVLAPNAVYSGKVQTGIGSHEDDDKSGNCFYWTFTTAADGNDVSAPTILSVTPLNNSTSVATSSGLTVTFSEPMNAGTINTSTFTVKQGTTIVPGTVSYSGTTATFTPSVALAPNAVFSGTISTGAKDLAGNAITSNFSWSFTTSVLADLTAPTVLSVTPLLNAAAVAVNTKVTVTFSEAMNNSTISSSTFILKQGSALVPGTVTYSGTTATFTPTSALTGNTLYTVTVTTGAKDAAGNAIAASYSWSFTTTVTIAMLSFSSDVVPVLALCNNCHTHPWTTSPVASTFYTNLVNAGYINPSSPTTAKIYTKLSGGHAGGTSISTADINKVLTWITQGSKNN